MRAAPFQGRRAHSGIPTNAAVRKRAQRRRPNLQETFPPRTGGVRSPAHSRHSRRRFGAVPPRIHANCGTASAPFPRAFTPIAAPLRRRPPRTFAPIAAPLRRRSPRIRTNRFRHFGAVPPRIRTNRFRRFGAVLRAFTPIASAGWRRFPRQSLPPVYSTYANPPPSQGRGRVFAPWAGRMPRDGRRPALCRGGSGSPRHNRSGAFKTVGGCAHSARRRSPASSMPEAPFPRLRRAVTPRRIPRGTRRSPSPCRSRGPRASGG